MALPQALLEKLVCPQCKGKMEYREAEDRLICHNCKLAYPIEDNIPVLLLDEAEKL